MQRSPVRRMLGIAGATVVFAGCGGGEFNLDFRSNPPEQHVLAADSAAAPLTLPSGARFSIHIKKSDQDPGATGTARGDSDASADGAGFCAAQAAGGGIASAEFSLGHRIENRSGRPQSVIVDISFDLKQTLSAAPLPGTDALGSASLNLVVIDSHKRVSTNVPVLQVTSDQLLSSTSTKDQRTLAMRFEPGLSYDVVLWGKASATTATGQNASARVEVGQVRMTFTFTPASSQPAGQ